MEVSKRKAQEAQESAETEKCRADKAIMDKKREVLLRKGLEKSVEELELHIQTLESQVATQQEKSESLERQAASSQ